MSKDLVVCMLDLEKFQAVQGSEDEQVLKRVLATKLEEIASHDKYLRGWAEEHPYTSVAVAIEQIVNGSVDVNLMPLVQFEHAAAMIADVLGVPLESESLTEAREAFWEEIDAIITKCQPKRSGSSVWPTLDELLKRGPCLKVPLDPALRLGTGFLTAAETAKMDVTIAHLDPEESVASLELVWAEEALEAVLEYRYWVQTASKAGMGLFFHC